MRRADRSEQDEALRSSPATADMLSRSMPTSLCALFALNGLTLALPQTALLFMVNTRINIPVAWVPSFAAFAFLPCSLKPCYAYLSACWLSLLPGRLGQRDVQIATLLVCSGLFGSCLALLPAHATVTFIILNFGTNIFSAWPEFLLGLTMLDQAVHDAASDSGKQYNRTVSEFQAQAATLRSAGSFVAHILVILFFASLHVRDVNARGELNDSTVAVLFVSTGILNCVGACIALIFQVGNHVNLPGGAENEISTEQQGRGFGQGTHCEAHTVADRDSPLHSSLLDPLLQDTDAEHSAEETCINEEASGNTVSDHASLFFGVILLQASVVVLTMRQPIELVISAIAWKILAGSCLAGFIVILAGSTVIQRDSSWWKQWQRHYRMGLYLILRNAVPSFTYIMCSYFYTVFAGTPSLLQFFSLFDMSLSMFACWTYQKIWSQYSQHRQLLWLIVGTTILASVASVGNVALVRVLDPRGSNSLFVKIGWTLLMKTLVGVTSEWQFLPDVVLATLCIDTSGSDSPVDVASSSDTPPAADICLDKDTCLERGESPESDQNDEQQQVLRRNESASIGIQYGSLLSCIDFGGQLGALLAAPLVTWVGTSRDNDWHHLDWLQGIGSASLLCSVAFIGLVFSRSDICR